MIRNQKGQALIETVVISLTWFLLIKGMVMMFILVSSSLWIQHSLYQGLVCLAEGRNAPRCKESLVTNIKKGIPLGKINDVHLQGNFEHWSGTLNWNFYKWKWNFKERLVLP